MMVYRHLHLKGATSAEIRTATFDGREHLVVPVIALMEGVIWPVNAPQPEFVSAETLAIAPQAWNGEVVVMDHPVDSRGMQISANEPDVIERYAFGRLFNTCSSEEILRYKKLRTEAWLDVAASARVGKDAEDVLRRAREKEPIEVSVGAFIVMDDSDGEYDGQKYHGSWLSIAPDHLAMLPYGAVGACSVEMGCGAPRAAKGRAMVHLVTARGLEIHDPTRTENDPKVQPAGFNPANFSDGKLLHGREVIINVGDKRIGSVIVGAIKENSKGAGMKTREERIAALKASERLSESALQACTDAIGDDDLSALEGAVASAKDGEKVDVPAQVKKRSLRERFIDLISKFAGAESVSDVELRDALDRSLRSTVPGYLGIAAVFAEEKQVVYAAAPEDSVDYWRCSYAVGSDGAVKLGSKMEKVKRVERWEALTASGATMAAACGCGGARTTAAADTTTPAAAPAHQEGEQHMDKSQRVKALIDNPKTPWKAADQAYLEGMTDERLAEVEQHATEETAPKKDEPAAEPTTPAAAPAAAAANGTETETEEQQLAKLPKSLRDMVSRAQAREKAQRTALIATLKSAQREYSEAEMGKMATEDLERMARLVKADVQADADYTGVGFPRAAGSNDDYIVNPPNGYKAAIAKRQQQPRKE